MRAVSAARYSVAKCIGEHSINAELANHAVIVLSHESLEFSRLDFFLLEYASLYPVFSSSVHSQAQLVTSTATLCFLGNLYLRSVFNYTT